MESGANPVIGTTRRLARLACLQPRAFARGSASHRKERRYQVDNLRRGARLRSLWGLDRQPKAAVRRRRLVAAFHTAQIESPRPKVNRAKAEALMVAGKMEAASLAEIVRANQDGRWERAYDDARTSEVPHDLTAALILDERAHFLRNAGRRKPLRRSLSHSNGEEGGNPRQAHSIFVSMCASRETTHPRR